MIAAISHIALLVRDYDEALEFYVGRLGFKLIEDSHLGDKRWVRIAPPGGQGSELLLSKGVREQQASIIGNQAGGGVLFFMRTDDFDSDYEKFLSAGVHFTEPPRNEAYGKVAVFCDLYGNRIDLIEPSR